MSAVKDRNRQRTTLQLDRDLVAAAQHELGTDTITETIEAALRRIVVGKPRILGSSGQPPVAHRVDEALDEMGFGS